MRKILKMPKRGSTGTEEETVPIACEWRSEHIIHYPRLQRGTHFADFMRDKRMEVYHCIIQCEGSNQILSWTQHPSLEAARKTAEADLTLIVGSTAAAM